MDASPDYIDDFARFITASPSSRGCSRPALARPRRPEYSVRELCHVNDPVALSAAIGAFYAPRT